MPPNEITYSLGEICSLADVTPRTVRYYIAEGLLRSPGVGPGAKYTEGHLLRLRLIRRLQRGHLPLSEIRSRIGTLSDEEVRGLVAAPEPAHPPGSAVEYIQAVLAGRGGANDAARSGALALPSQPARVLLREEVPVYRVAEPDAFPAPAPVQQPTLPDGYSPSHAASLPAPEPEGRPSTPAPQSMPDRKIPDDQVVANRSPASPVLAGAASGAPPPMHRHPLATALTAHLTRPQPPAPERSQWERISLAPDVELHLRRPLSRIQNRQVARLLEAARGIFQEEET